MGRTNKIVDVRDTPGSAKDAGSVLLFYFDSKITWRKGKKRSNFPVKKSGSPCKTVHPGIPIKMAENEVIN